MIRVLSRDHEPTNVYAQQIGKDLRLLVTSLDGGDVTFVQVRIRPEQLMKFIDESGRGGAL